MNEIIRKLVKDLKSRLVGKRSRPSRKEIEGWGPLRIPFIVPVLLSTIYALFTMIGLPSMGISTNEGLWFWLFGTPGIIAFIILVFYAYPRLNRHLIVKAYKGLLENYERFTLFEYCKYLKRQIEKAQKDPAIGGPAEVQQLKQMHSKLAEILQKGAGEQGAGVSSPIAAEALAAESFLEAYEATSYDQLKNLDSRLPEELRQQIDELDRLTGHESLKREEQ